MIVEWLVQVACGFAAWVGSLFENIDIPSWVTDASSGAATFISSAAGLGAWFPWDVLGVVVGVVAAVYGCTFAVKLCMRIASYIPFFGGAG